LASFNDLFSWSISDEVFDEAGQGVFGGFFHHDVVHFFSDLFNVRALSITGFRELSLDFSCEGNNV